MGFGKSNALIDEDPDDGPEDDVVQAFAPTVPSEAIEFAADGIGSPAEAVPFAAPDLPPAANDEGAAVLHLADPSAGSLEERLGEILAQQAESTLPVADAAPAIPRSAFTVRPPTPGAASGSPSPTGGEPRTSSTPEAPAAEQASGPEREDLGLMPDQQRLFDSLGDEEREEIKHRLRTERERLEADRRRLEMERKRAEAAPPVTGLAMLAHALLPRRNTLERRESDFRNREAFLQSGYVGENYLRLKQRDFLRTAADLAARQATLAQSVNSYNAAFGATEPGRRYLDKVERLVAGGMQRDAAQAFVREGNVVGAKEDAAEAAKDPRVAAARAAMYDSAAQLEASAGKFGADYQLLQKNFPEQISREGTGDVVKAFDRIARETPKPVAEPGVEPDRTLEKRLAKMADGIKALVEAISKMIQSVLRPKG
ncbi:hypothetical protein [Methylobacterium fujisawaense]|jgi:hypothetical protein